MRGMWVWGLAAVSLAMAEGPPNGLTPKEARDGWLLLFDGRTLAGWTAHGSARWSVESGVLVGEGAGKGSLRTSEVFSKYELHSEFRTGGPIARIQTDGYALPNGKRLERGRWHNYDVYNSPQGFRVLLDYERIAGGVEGSDTAGAIGLDHPAGSVVEYRTIKLRPLGLEPLCQRNSLKDWRVVSPPGADAHWSARGGAIHLDRGPAQIETRKEYGDFVLQYQQRATSGHARGGVYFRGVPGRLWTGTPVPARSEPDRWITVTVVARGPHVTVWKDGLPVADRVEAGGRSRGPISLQVRDAQTDVEFRDVFIGAL